MWVFNARLEKVQCSKFAFLGPQAVAEDLPGCCPCFRIAPVAPVLPAAGPAATG